MKYWNFYIPKNPVNVTVCNEISYITSTMIRNESWNSIFRAEPKQTFKESSPIRTNSFYLQFHNSDLFNEDNIWLLAELKWIEILPSVDNSINEKFYESEFSRLSIAIKSKTKFYKKKFIILYNFS